MKQSIVPEVRGIVLAGYWKLPPEDQNCRPSRDETSSGAKNENKMPLNVKQEQEPFFSGLSMIDVAMFVSVFVCGKLLAGCKYLTAIITRKIQTTNMDLSM